MNSPSICLNRYLSVSRSAVASDCVSLISIPTGIYSNKWMGSSSLILLNTQDPLTSRTPSSIQRCALPRVTISLSQMSAITEVRMRCLSLWERKLIWATLLTEWAPSMSGTFTMVQLLPESWEDSTDTMVEEHSSLKLI
jgi:hypothetical protein